MTRNAQHKRKITPSNAALEVLAKTAEGGLSDSRERLIQERIRLAIISALAVNESLSFNELKDLLDTTDGNLSVHARKLEEANYIDCTKTFKDRTPRTQYRITEEGRRVLEKYLNHMEALIKTVRKK